MQHFSLRHCVCVSRCAKCVKWLMAKIIIINNRRKPRDQIQFTISFTHCVWRASGRLRRSMRSSTLLTFSFFFFAGCVKRRCLLAILFSIPNEIMTTSWCKRFYSFSYFSCLASSSGKQINHWPKWTAVNAPSKWRKQKIARPKALTIWSFYFLQREQNER